jgi:uncharacterized protein
VFHGLVSISLAAGIALVGLGIGFMSGLFGKGGAAIATPLLHALGVPPMLAVGSPLPATLPSTLAAASAYRRERLIDPAIVGPSVAVGVPAAVLGALATHWINGTILVVATELLVVALGVRLMFLHRAAAFAKPAPDAAPPTTRRIALVALCVGLVSGLLANSGGFLLAPLYVSVLRLPIKKAFGASLVVSAALAIPATIVHAALGHVDWAVTAVFAIGSVPLSLVGARLAVRANPRRLERIYGLVLALVGALLLTLATS